MKLSKLALTKILAITRQELDELDLPAGSVELAEAIEAYIAHRIESKSQSSLRRKLERLRAQLYATQAERISVSNRLYGASPF